MSQQVLNSIKPDAVRDSAAYEPAVGKVKSSGGASGRVPTLDGLRAISIILVLLGHGTGTVNFPSSTVLMMYANYGVRVFFVISGYLITSLLLKEAAKTGRVSLRDFYIRRVLRIFPAFYVFVITLIILSVFGKITLRDNDLLFSLTYTINFHHDHSWYVGHLWSLAVEEQFYLLWPAVVALCCRRRALQIAATVFLISPALRLGIYYFLPSWRDGIGHIFPTVADSLAIGCFLAGTRDWLHQQKWYMRLLEPRPFLLIASLAIVANFTQDRPRVEMAVGESLMNLCIGICIDRCITYPNGIVGRILEWKPLAYIGVLSYSIYIWQQLFLNRMSTSILTSFPLNLALVAIAALLSYYAVEQPFLRLKSRFTSHNRRPTANNCTPALTCREGT